MDVTVKSCSGQIPESITLTIICTDDSFSMSWGHRLQCLASWGRERRCGSVHTHGFEILEGRASCRHWLARQWQWMEIWNSHQDWTLLGVLVWERSRLVRSQGQPLHGGLCHLPFNDYLSSLSLTRFKCWPSCFYDACFLALTRFHACKEY